MDPFLGEIRAFGFGLIPKNWLPCDGRLMPVSTNQALFALLSVRYGGNGTTTFGLPDLRGRVPLGFSANDQLGLLNGTETVTLSVNQIPQHTHSVSCSSTVATTSDPTNAVMAEAAGGLGAYGVPNGSFLAPTAVALGGGSQPHQNMQPSLVVNWCIAISGIFPARN
ncbi:phage tail protein [Delftia acidovorans]|uniref:phage tail protein n=1 Tax=Delftia acidovorans TaxID=80866 RepID=UPI00192C726D|nr:tail fiber protein [Delftia acidovorans]